MSTPAQAITRFDLSLSYDEFNLEANRRGYVGLQVLPPVAVAQQSSDFRKIAIKSLLGPIEDTRAAPDGTYGRDSFEWNKDSYATEDHGAEETLGDRALKMYGSEIRAEMIHRDRAINRVLQAFEAACAAAVFNTTTWTGEDLTDTANVAWSTQTTATPIDDIDAAIEKVKTNCGTKPNALVITDWGLRLLKRTNQVEDLLKYSGRDDPKNLGVLSGLSELFDLPKIIVADGFKNTAGRGQDATLARLWDSSMCMVCCIDDSADLENIRPTIGRTIMWQEENGPLAGADGQIGALVEEYREEARRGSVIRARNDRVIKILHPEAGFLITAIHS